MNRILTAPSRSATLDIDVVKSLVAIAETGSIKLAAPRLGRTPAALSMQMKKLEDTLGQLLFERGHTGMRLTPAGERLMPHARRMIEAERAALAQFRTPELSGEVNVGLIEDFGSVRLTRVLAAFARTHPRVTVNVVMGPSVELAAKLGRGELDLSVLTLGCAVEWQDGDRMLHEEVLSWIGCEGGRAWRQRPMPLAIAAQGCPWRRQALSALDAAGIEWRIAYTSESYAAQKAAVAADLAIAPMPRSALEPGFVRLGAAEGLPEPGRGRMGLRLAPRASARDATLALAEYMADSVRRSGRPS